MKKTILITLALIFVFSTLAYSKIFYLTKFDKNNVRALPGLESNILTRYDKETVLEALGKTENWILVKMVDGNQGWMHRSILQKITEKELAELVAKKQKEEALSKAEEKPAETKPVEEKKAAQAEQPEAQKEIKETKEEPKKG